MQKYFQEDPQNTKWQELTVKWLLRTQIDDDGLDDYDDSVDDDDDSGATG